MPNPRISVANSPSGRQSGTIATLATGRTAAIAFALLILGALAIALSPILVRISEIGPTTTAVWRVAIAVPVLMIWMIAEQKGIRQAHTAKPAVPRSLRDYGLLMLAGFLFAGDLAFWHWSVTFTSVANATLLANLAPVIVTGVSYLLFGERVTRLFMIGMLLSLAGAVLLMSDSLTISPETLFGDFLGVITALFYGGYIIAIGRLRARFSTATIMAWSALATTLFLIPAGLLSGESFWPATLTGWAILAALALISHVGGQGLITYALAHLPAAFSSVSLLVQPVAAAGLAWLFLGEAIGTLQAMGAGVVMAGIVMARFGTPRHSPEAPGAPDSDSGPESEPRKEPGKPRSQ